MFERPEVAIALCHIENAISNLVNMNWPVPSGLRATRFGCMSRIRKG